jgi:hypothetical protein
MKNAEAREFAFESFIVAFAPGNEQMIDQYFAEDVEFFNHSLAKSFTLNQVKVGAKEAYKKYQNLKSELKEVIVEGDKIAFRVEQQAFYVPDEENIKMEVMNMYTLVDGKVKVWRLWEQGYIKTVAGEN